MDLSVVVPCRNVASTLDQQLDALLSQQWSGKWEVVVVDNRSSDSTAQLVRERMDLTDRVRLVLAHEQDGVSYARNCGAESANGDVLLFCDGDDVVQPGWLAALATGLDQHPVVTGALDVIALNTPSLSRSRGISEGPATCFGSFPEVSGGNMGVRRDAYRRIGGFSTRHILEDKKFSLDASTAGLSVGYIPSAVVAYRYRTALRDLWTQGRNYARGRVQIAGELAESGQPRPARLAGWKSWLWLLAHMPDILDQERRRGWVWVAGNRIGQIEGSVRYRTLML